MLLFLTLWFGQAPKPHLWKALSHSRYAIREAASLTLSRNKALATWVVRGQFAGSQESRARCARILRIMLRCGRCNGTGCCEWYERHPLANTHAYPACLNCGAAWNWHDAQAMGPEYLHEVYGDQWFACRACKGTGVLTQVIK
jgi:hypothetical protein